MEVGVSISWASEELPEPLQSRQRRGEPLGWAGPWPGDAWADVEAAGKVAQHLGRWSCSVPRRRRSSEPAGEGEQVGCCF